MNIVVMTGRVTRDIELRKTGSGKQYCRFTLAVDRPGEGADYPSCTAWAKTAETMAKYLGKGSRISIQGRVQTGSYEKDGQTVYTTDIVCNTFEFLDTKKKEQEKEPEPEFVDVPEDDDDLPF